MNFADSYRDRRVMVTGHTGFKGTWLCHWLEHLGAKVSGLSLAPNTQPSIFDATGLARRMSSSFTDIRDAAAVAARMGEARPEIVFHLAAQPLVRRSYHDPLETFSTNITGTANVLEAARLTPGVKAIVCVTTDKVYANEEWPWPYRESDRLGGDDPYSASKACAEIVTRVYSHNLCKAAPDIGIATARGGNVVGGGDWSADRLIPDIVRAVQAGAPLTLRNPAAVRPWQHVLELCEGYLELGARLVSGDKAYREAWNFGPKAGDEVNVGELSRLFLEILERPGHGVKFEAAALKEAQLLRLDISKSTAHLAWRPRLSTRETLQWTAQWYAAHYKGTDHALTMTRDQLAAFIALRAEAPR